MHTPCIGTHNNINAMTISGLGKQLAGEAALVMENAKEGAQFALGLASFPTHRAPVTAQGEEKPPSRTQGTFLFAWLHLHNLSEKSTVSLFSLPGEGSGSPWKYCVQGL